MLKSLIKNIRFGLATNSSSSHSLVYRSEPVSDMVMSDGSSYDTEYGWGHFVLDSLGEKLMYALTDLLGSQHWWKEDVDPDEVDRLHSEYSHLFPELNKSHFEQALRGYIDHESVGTADVKTARDPLVEIHGGNDNGDSGCSDCSDGDDDYWYR